MMDLHGLKNPLLIPSQKDVGMSLASSQLDKHGHNLSKVDNVSIWAISNTQMAGIGHPEPAYVKRYSRLVLMKPSLSWRHAYRSGDWKFDLCLTNAS